MPAALTLGGQSLTTGAYDVADSGIDFGTADLMATILGAGDLRPEEIDQFLEEQRYVRGLVIPLRIGGGTPAAVVANTQTVIQKISVANRFNPVTLTFQPTGGNVSTFKVIGGSLVVVHDALAEMIGLYKDAELHLACLPFAYGSSQSLGSSGAPLITNQASPANVTLSPSPTGDVPGDVTLFVKNHAAEANGVQTITINATGGGFKLTYAGVTRPTAGTIAFNALASAVQTELVSIPAIGSGGVVVTGGAGGPYTCTFSISSVQLMTGDATALTGGTHSVSIVASPLNVAIRSLIASCIGGNTTWVASSNASGWTTGADGTTGGGGSYVTDTTPCATDTPLALAHFTAPTLPSDRPFRIYLRASQKVGIPGYAKFRLRLLSGASEIVGQWVAIPQENNVSSVGTIGTDGWCLIDCGIYYLPVGEVGLLGAQSTTVYVEAQTNDSANTFAFQQALFLPNSSTLIAETQDTTKTLGGALSVVRLESDMVYDNSGNPAGGTVIGSHIRSIGGRYMVYTSQFSINTLVNTQHFSGENVDAWAIYTPRYLHLA